MRLAISAIVFWVVLVEGNLRSWYLGLPFVALSCWGASAVGSASPWRVRLLGVPGLAAHFIVQSVIAGTAVARLALRRELDFTPGLVSFHTILPAGAPLGLFTSITNLMPGTVCVSVRTQTVTVHVLDTRSPHEPGLRQLEQKVSALFGLD